MSAWRRCRPLVPRYWAIVAPTRRGRISSFASLAALAWIVLATPPGRTAPRDELLRLVPGDVGFCLLIEDVRGHAKALLDSPFVSQFRASPMAKLIDANETQKLTLADQFLQQYLQISAQQLRDDILGDALVLAYRPGPPESPDKEAVFFLIRARNPRLLADLIERVNTLQKDSGDLKELTEQKYAGHTYHRRVEAKGISYYYLQGPIVAFASRAEALHELIDLEGRASVAEEPPLARQFRLLGVDKPLASLLVNPRAFDAHFRHKATTASAGQAKALGILMKYWEALEGLGLSVILEKDFEMTLTMRARENLLPPAARRFFAAAPGASELPRYFPAHAMLAVSGRADFAAVVEVLGGFLPDDARQAVIKAIDGSVGAIFGREFAKEILPHLGPDWGLCVVAPPGGDWFPHVLAALRVQTGRDGDDADRKLLNAVNALTALLAFHSNGGKPGPSQQKLVVQDKVEVRYLVNDAKFPPGFRPAFALKAGYLVIGNSPDALRRFPSDALGGNGRTAGESPFLRLSFREVHRYLSDKRQPISAFAAAKHRISQEEAGRRLDGLLTALALFDSLEISKRADPERLIVSLRLRMAQPLK